MVVGRREQSRNSVGKEESWAGGEYIYIYIYIETKGGRKC